MKKSVLQYEGDSSCKPDFPVSQDEIIHPAGLFLCASLLYLTNFPVSLNTFLDMLSDEGDAGNQLEQGMGFVFYGFAVG